MKIFFQIILIFGIVSAKAFTPLGNPTIETLEVSGKGREYVVLKDTAIEYEIEGPKIIQLYSRKPIPKKQNTNLVEISYNIKLDDTEVIYHTIKAEVDKKTISKKHLAHSYSSADVIFINVPKGKHILKIDSEEKPLLFRLTKKKRPKRSRSDIYIEDINNNPQFNVITGKNTIPYSKISSNKTANYHIKDIGELWLYVRPIHKNNSPGLFPIVLSFSNNDTLSSVLYSPAKYIFYSEISQESKIENTQESIGKLRTFLIYPRVMYYSAVIGVKNHSKDFDILIHGEFIHSDE